MTLEDRLRNKFKSVDTSLTNRNYAERNEQLREHQLAMEAQEKKEQENEEIAKEQRRKIFGHSTHPKPAPPPKGPLLDASKIKIVEESDSDDESGWGSDDDN